MARVNIQRRKRSRQESGTLVGDASALSAAAHGGSSSTALALYRTPVDDGASLQFVRPGMATAAGVFLPVMAPRSGAAASAAAAAAAAAASDMIAPPRAPLLLSPAPPLPVLPPPAPAAAATAAPLLLLPPGPDASGYFDQIDFQNPFGTGDGGGSGGSGGSSGGIRGRSAVIASTEQDVDGSDLGRRLSDDGFSSLLEASNLAHLQPPL